MSAITRTYTFTDGTNASGDEVETEIGGIVTAFNNHDSGASSFTTPKVSADPTAALGIASKQYVDHYSTWGRPPLVYVSATQVDVADNTGTANQTGIVFPDGTRKNVTEDTSSTNKYRRFDITATAEFKTGTEDSGMLSGESEAVSTWYAIYAVISQVDSDNFCLVGTTNIPTQGNFSTLNTDFTANKWVYLGMIRNGDNSGTTGDILNFIQVGNWTFFLNSTSANNLVNTKGIQMATTAGATNLAYTYSAGTGATNIPAHIIVALWTFGINAGSGTADARSSDNADSIESQVGTAIHIGSTISPAAEGLRVNNGSSVAMDINLRGFVDGALGLGSNPIIF